MNSPSNRRHSWSWLPVAFSCCGLFFVGDAVSRATAQEKPDFGPFETRESGQVFPNNTAPLQRRQLTLIGQVEPPRPAPAQPAVPLPLPPVAAFEFLPRLSPVELRILNALSEPTEVAFNQNPLEEALRYLKDLHGIEIWIDKEALSADGIATDKQVSLNLSGITLRSALRLLLEPLALTCVIEAEVLKITTQKAADKTILTRTYPVGDLFSSREEAEELVESLVCGLGLVPKGKEAPRSLAVSVPSGAIIARLSRPQNDQLLQLLRDLREAKSLVPKRTLTGAEPLRNGRPTSDPTRSPPKIETERIDEFSPGLKPALVPADDFDPRPRARDARPKLDEFSPPREAPAPVKPAIRKQS